MAWTHQPSPGILLWCIFICPFTTWDTLYIALRPHTLPGHKWHSPLWTPFGNVAEIDLTYSEKAWEEQDGFIMAQGVLNMVEAVLLGSYFYLVWKNGGIVWGRYRANRIHGAVGARAALLGLIGNCLTATKGTLYFLTECFSGFPNVGHNDLVRLITAWGIMNFLYTSISVYSIFYFRRDILQGLEKASESAGVSKKTTKTK